MKHPSSPAVEVPAPANIPVNGAAIRARRKDMGETITSLAAKVPMSYGYLSQLERRHRVSMSPPLFRRLAAVLGVDDREIRAE